MIVKWIPPTILVTLAAINIAMLSCGSADKWIKMNTPAAMQAMTGVDPQITVAEGLHAYERFELEVRQCTEEFMDEFMDKMAVVSYINSTLGLLGQVGIDAASNSGIPFLATLAIGVAALATRSPGTKAREKRLGDAAEARGIVIGKNGGSST